MKGLFILYFCISCAVAIRFIEPASAAALGEIYTNMYELSIPFTDGSMYYKNYTVVPDPGVAALCCPDSTPCVTPQQAAGNFIFGLDEVCGSFEKHPNAYSNIGAVGALLGTPGVIPPW